MFSSLLVANRGEIARRIIRTAKSMGIETIAVHSPADAALPYVREADCAVELPSNPPAESYLSATAVLEAALRTGAEAIHPGYGFLSESAEFARKVLDAGLVWVGPEPESIESMGDKIAARQLMQAAGVPISPGTVDPVTSAEDALAAAESIGYPVMVKAAAGGGGIGMSVAHSADELVDRWETARTRAERFFSSPAVFLERFVERARHIEVQILGMVDGTVVTVGERDCSVQRRHQKVVEESPAPELSEQLRSEIHDIARRAGEAVDYRNAGTVELLVDADSGEAWFLEMNTRLQVEHPVTEQVWGIDLVREQFLIAAGDPPSPEMATLSPNGHALELRIYAEDPVKFLPRPGTIEQWREPTGQGVRVDSGYESGNVVTPFYDPLLAKLIVHAPDRQTCLERARTAVSSFTITGVTTNLPFFDEVLTDRGFVTGRYDTGIVGSLRDQGRKDKR